MALIVEDGTGMPNSESYASVAEADSYFANRGNDAWADLDTGQKEVALRLATDYMLQNYRQSWKGTRVKGTLDQALDWPRHSVYTDDITVTQRYAGSRFLVPSDIVPKEVKHACIELAWKTTTAELAPDLERGVISETIGPISTTYDKGSPQYTRYRAVDLILRVLLIGNNISAGIIRS